MFSQKIFINKYIVIGEVHGVIENIKVLHSLLENISEARDKKTILFAFEWQLSDSESDTLNTYIQDGILTTQVKQILTELHTDQSGAFSDQHESFLRTLHTINTQGNGLKIHFTAFDSTGWTDWNDRDRKMATRILDTSKDMDTVVVVTGQLHAQKGTFTLLDSDTILTPMAMHLPKTETHSILIKYIKGQFYNFGLQNFSSNSPLSPEIVSRYDEIITINNATPTSH